MALFKNLDFPQKSSRIINLKHLKVNYDDQPIEIDILYNFFGSSYHASITQKIDISLNYYYSIN